MPKAKTFLSKTPLTWGRCKRTGRVRVRETYKFGVGREKQAITPFRGSNLLCFSFWFLWWLEHPRKLAGTPGSHLKTPDFISKLQQLAIETSHVVMKN